MNQDALRVDRRLLDASRWASAATFVVGGFGLGAWAAYIPLLKDGLALDEAALGVVLFGVAVGFLAGMPLAAVAMPRLGVARSITASGFAFALAVALPPLAPTHASLILAALLLGVSFGFMDVAMNAHSTAIEKAMARPIMSSLHAFFSLGVFLGSGSAGALLALGATPAIGMSLASAGLVMVVGFAASRLALPPAYADDVRDLKIFRLPTRAVLGLGCLALLGFIMEIAVIDWGAVFLTEATGATPAFAAYGAAAFAITMAVGRFLGDKIVERLGPVLTAQLSAATAALGLALIVLAPDRWAALPGFVIAGLGAANIVPVLISASARAPGVTPAAGVAMVVTIAYTGGLMGPPLVGFVAHHLGLRSAFAMIVVAATIIAAAAAAVIPRKPKAG